MQIRVHVGRVELMHVLNTVSYSHDYSHSTSPVDVIKGLICTNNLPACYHLNVKKKNGIPHCNNENNFHIVFTMEILIKRPIWCVFEHHHPRERFFLLTKPQQIDEILMIYSWERLYLLVHKGKKKANFFMLMQFCKRISWGSSTHIMTTFFLKQSSQCFDQSLLDLIVVDTTAISTPDDKVPL